MDYSIRAIHTAAIEGEKKRKKEKRHFNEKDQHR